MKIYQNYTALVAWAILCGSAVAADPAVSSPAATLIVPGKSIGPITLGADPALAEEKLGESAGSDAAMGGKGCIWWFVDAHGNKAAAADRTGELGLFCLKDMEHDSRKHPGKVTITGIYVTSGKFATAEGIAPGSTIDAIRAKFPGIRPDDDRGGDANSWWGTGEGMEFYMDDGRGIGFAIRKKDGVCVEIAVVPPRKSAVSWFRWVSPDLMKAKPSGEQ